jgi:hypothetical protein
MPRPLLWVLLVWFASAAHAKDLGTGLLLLRLGNQAQVTEQDAVQVAAIFAGVAAAATNPKAAEAGVRAAGILKSRERYQPPAPLTKGFAALLFVRALKLTGGWAAHIFGFDRHSAYAELEFRHMVSPLGASDRMTGTELISLFRLAKEYAATHGRDRGAR